MRQQKADDPLAADHLDLQSWKGTEEIDGAKRTPSVDVLQQLEGRHEPRREVHQQTVLECKRTGPGRWIAKCPSHEDRSPSLTVNEKEEGVLLVHCYGGCSIDEVVGKVGLKVSDLYPPRPKSEYRPPDRTAFHAADVPHGIGR